MTELKIEITKLTALDGYVLTNGEVYGKEVFLGKNDNAKNWHEITDAEYAEIVVEQEAKAREIMLGGTVDA